MIGEIVAFAVLLTMAAALWRLVQGPSEQDRALAGMLMAALGAIGCGAIAAARAEIEFVVAAFVLALGVLALATTVYRRFRLGSLQPAVETTQPRGHRS
jgi:multisubunit Na+/H+ antiporter MnhF subunit